MATKPKMSSVVVLEGLMVFHYDERTRICEIGVLKADRGDLPREHEQMPPHIFAINPSPEPAIDPAVLNRRRAEGNIWTLDVESNEKKSREGQVQANSGIPLNRHNPNGDQLELGWLIDVQNEFHPNEPLSTNTGALQPIIQVRTGRIYTCCKTNGIDVFGGPFGTGRPFGFMAESVAIGIDTAEGEEIVMKVAGTSSDIFRLKYRERGYRISISNTPADEHKDGHKDGHDGEHDGEHHDMPPTAHFELYYSLFYKDCKDQVHLKLSEPAEESPNPCAMVMPNKPGNGRGPFEPRSVYPYKCGGIAHSRPLA